MFNFFAFLIGRVALSDIPIPRPLQFNFISNLICFEKDSTKQDISGKGRGQGLQIFNKIFCFEKQTDLNKNVFKAYQAHTQYHVYAMVHYFVGWNVISQIIIAFL